MENNTFLEGKIAARKEAKKSTSSLESKVSALNAQAKTLLSQIEAKQKEIAGECRWS